MKLHDNDCGSPCLVCLTWATPAPAADATDRQRRMPSRRPPRDVKQLAIQQGAIADKYSKLEKLLEDMARIEAVNDRAARRC